MVPSINVRPIEGAPAGLGAVIDNLDVNSLTDATFAELRQALYTYNVVCIKASPDITPAVQAELTRRFDPTAQSYGHGKTVDAKRSILHPDLKTIPHQPEVQVIGHGFIPEYEGLKNIQLKHPHHATFHKTRIADEDDHDYTRFYRWHIDAALYGALHPPLVTSLLAVKVPSGRTQTLLYTSASPSAQPEPTSQVPLGTTAFTSGYTSLSLLTPSQRHLALTSLIEYAPHPYIWISTAKSRPDGLGMESDNNEVPLSSLPAYTDSEIQILPMTWKNPLTGELALQIHPSPVRKIHLEDGSVIDDLVEVRRIVHELQRPGISPEHVYCHDWEEGDLVLFNNHGVLHSVVGAFGEGEVRLFRQCNLAASKGPVGPMEEDLARMG